MDVSSLDGQAYLIIAVLSLAGAVLGGAVAHWRRGSAYIVTGAIIGGLAAFLFAFAGAVYSGVIYAAGFVVILVIVVYGWLSG